MAASKKIILAVTGASGALYAKLLLHKLDSVKDSFEKLDVIFSENAKAVWKYELGEEPAIPDSMGMFENNDLFAAPASGSAAYTHMLVCPCSMASLAAMAQGLSNNLILRAADVMLKERRTLIVVPREMPYSLIHIRNMETLTLAGGLIIPASPAFYHRPENLEDAMMSVIDKILLHLDIDAGQFRWGI
jgi:4-hydroxy-3-polyprenylbenzoate decarboxylase